MIIDTTQTRAEHELRLRLDIINIQDELQQAHNNPNIRFGCSCGKNICYGHAPKLRGTDADQYICRHGSLDGLIIDNRPAGSNNDN